MKTKLLLISILYSLFANAQATKEEMISQHITSLKNASTPLGEGDNLSDLDIMTLKYNEARKAELPFTPYQKESEVEYISSSNVWKETGQVNGIFYTSYYSDGFDSAKLVNKKAPVFVSLHNREYSQITFFSEIVNYESSLQDEWVVACELYRCSMTKGTIHLTIQGYKNSDITEYLFRIQENDRDKVISDGEIKYFNDEMRDGRPVSIKIDDLPEYSYSMFNGFNEFYEKLPTVIKQISNGEKVITKYDYKVGQDLCETYTSEVKLSGFDEAYAYMVWRFNQLKKSSK